MRQSCRFCGSRYDMADPPAVPFRFRHRVVALDDEITCPGTKGCGSGGWIRTTDLQVMGLTSCLCSTPQYIPSTVVHLCTALTDEGYGFSPLRFVSLCNSGSCYELLPAALPLYGEGGVHGKNAVAVHVGFEPTTYGLTVRRSTRLS